MSQPAPGGAAAPNASSPPLAAGTDWALLAVAIALGTVGVVMSYSASVFTALQEHGGDDAHFLYRHLAYAGAALGALLVGIQVPHGLWRRLAYPMLFAALGLLVAVLLWGETVNRATRWLDFGFVRFQPAEFAKLAFVVYLARSLAKKASSDAILTFNVGLLPHFIVWTVVFGLCMAQPDLGTGIVLAIMLFGLTYIAGTRVAYLLFTGGAGFVGLMTFIIHDPMRSKRFLAFLEPLAHRQATGYQLFNGKLAIASGGFFGQGLGASRQKLGFIPESHTDFVLAIIGEELGLFAIALVAIGFIFVLLRGLRIAQNAPCEFSRLLAAGITLFLGTQAAINFGVVMGLLPTKGLTLPFVSYGGSSLVVVALALGILLGVGRRSAPAAAAGTRQTAAGAATPAGPAEERG